MLTRRGFTAAASYAICGVGVVAAEAFAQTTEQKMANIAVQLTTADYDKWRPVFDKYKSVRKDAGITSERVFRNADDPNQVMIWWEATDANKVMQVLESNEVKGYMKEAGVVGPPKVHVLP